MEYRTVYSILDDAARVPWSHVAIGLVGAPTAAAFAWRKRDWVMLVFTAGWGLFWNYGILPASWTIYHDHERAQEQLRSGDCEIVEGTVEQFHPMPYHGHSLESFTVNGVRFEYSDFDDSKPGFNHTKSHGGPIHAGMRVRIHYREGSILQIQVPASPYPTKTYGRVRPITLSADLAADVATLCGVREHHEPLVNEVYESSFTKTFARAQIAGKGMEAGGIEPPQRQKRPISNLPQDSAASSAKTAGSDAQSRLSRGPETSRKRCRSTRKTGPGPVEQ